MGTRSENIAPTGVGSWAPPWVSSLGTAVWLCDPRGTVAWLNRRAEGLLGGEADDCVGRPCEHVVGGASSKGVPVCRPGCDVRRRAAAGREIEPVVVRLPSGDGRGRWILIIHIALTAPDGSRPWLLHCACDVDRAQRTEEYLSRVASRSAPRSGAPVAALSPRELEILELLAEDNDPQRIAARLHVSYTTIRNHVQHILEKLDVHSAQEAVAAHVLERGGRDPRSGSDSVREESE